MKQFKIFKIRASACGQIMKSARSKNELLSETAKGYIDTWLKEQIYKRKKEISSKYIEKGLICEDNSIDFIAEHFGYGILIKNEKHYEDDYITGTPDIVLRDIVIDVKNSWDCFSFPLFSDDYNKDYYYQAQCYMHLTGIHKYKLIYVLSDTPENLIASELKKYSYAHGVDVDNDIYDEFHKKMTYKNVENKYKIKVYNIEYDINTINDIYKKVSECRVYINDKLKTI